MKELIVIASFIFGNFYAFSQMPSIDRPDIRQEKSVPVLQSLHHWLKETIVKVTPASTIGKAIAYMPYHGGNG